MKYEYLDKIKSIAFVFGMVSMIGLLACPAYADSEKTLLMLQGDACSAHSQDIKKSLLGTKGVTSVDLDSMPGHVIVLHDSAVSAGDLINAIRNSVKTGKENETPCDAMVMEMNP